MSNFGDRKESTISVLLGNAQEGEEAAFMEFCTEAMPHLYRYMQYQCSTADLPTDNALDFCQDAFLKAAEVIKAKVTAGQQVQISLAWLKKTAYHKMIDYLRRAGRWTSDNEIDYYGDTLEQDNEAYDEIEKFFDWLRASEKDIIEQVVIKGLNMAEAAEQLDISEDAAKRRYYRAVVHLQDLIQEHGSIPIGP